MQYGERLTNKIANVFFGNYSRGKSENLTKKASADKYTFTSVFPNEAIMEEALRAISKKS